MGPPGEFGALFVAVLGVGAHDSPPFMFAGRHRHQRRDACHADLATKSSLPAPIHLSNR